MCLTASMEIPTESSNITVSPQSLSQMRASRAKLKNRAKFYKIMKSLLALLGDLYLTSPRYPSNPICPMHLNVLFTVTSAKDDLLLAVISAVLDCDIQTY